jgi:transcriptional regulator with XRE-family HTH domain
VRAGQAGHVDEDLAFVERAALAVRSGRKRLGLSQRALAERTGMSKSAVARVEAAYPALPVETVASALAGVGLRLRLEDADGRAWAGDTHALGPDLEDARDGAGRRLPAQLEPRVHDLEPSWRFVRRQARARAAGRRDVPLFDRSLTYERAETTQWRRWLAELSERQ